MDLRRELICLAGGLPLRGCVCAWGLMLRKRITNRAKGAAKPKGFQKVVLRARAPMKGPRVGKGKAQLAPKAIWNSR